MTPYERGHLDGQIAMRERAAAILSKNKIGDELAYGSITQAWLERAILSLQPEGADQREAAAGPCVSVPSDESRLVYLFDLLFEDTKDGKDKLNRIRTVVDRAMLAAAKEE